MQLKLRNTLARNLSHWNLAQPILIPYKPFSKKYKRGVAARINTSELAPSARSTPLLKPKVDERVANDEPQRLQSIIPN